MSSLVELGGERVVELVLNRPDARNALSTELCDAIVDALGTIARSADARVVVVRGEGKAFCSGADFAAVSGPSGLDFLPAFERMLEELAKFHLPTVASIHGAALGGGLQLATVCDFRIAAADARIGIPSARLGIVVNFENVQRLVMMAGVPVAKEVLMTGRTYTGDEAERSGLVTRSVPPEDLDATVRSFVDDIAALAPLSVRGAKRTIAVVADAMVDARTAAPDAVRAIDDLVMQAYNSADLQEGIEALSQKRPPRFEGR
ncbi:MAG: enoyl-CoA hydratase [Actinobacteria bacterium]|nr:enoyl-CoA hydratase [Actinomycetota bacterium]